MTRYIDALLLPIDSDGDGVAEFTDLTDTPADYTSAAGCSCSKMG